MASETERNRRRETVAFWLSDRYDPELVFAADGTVLVDDTWRTEADALLAVLDALP